MGAEAKCRAELDGRRLSGTALLETEELLFRGDVRVKIPFKRMTKVEASNGRLEITYDAGRAAFELGPAAATWAEKIRSPKSLLDKLGVKPEHRVTVVGIDDAEFLEQLARRAAAVTSGRFAKQSDIVFLGADSATDLRRIERAAGSIVPAGAVWVIHPKGKGALTDTEIFAAAKKAGLTYTKVAKFSETHTAEKLVIPVAARTKR